MKATVVIPVYNAAATLGKLLEALKNQTQREFEIIAVNDGSNDNSLAVLNGFNLPNLRVLNQENKGPAAARNFGAMEAKGDIVVFTDADCVPEPRWLEEMIKPFDDKDVIGVQGRYKNLTPENIVSEFVQREIDERYERMSKLERIDFIGSYSAAYRRSVFLEANGFDEAFLQASGEDPELSYRLASKGKKMVFNPNAVVAHPHPNSLKHYLKQKQGRGYWGALLYKKHPEKMGGQSYNSSLYFIHIAFTMFSFLSFLILLPVKPIAAITLLLLLLGTTLPSSLWIGKKNPRLLAISPVLIILRNLAIGFGIFSGASKALGKTEKMLAGFFAVYSGFMLFTFFDNYLFSDEGTHLLLSIFYRDFFANIISNHSLSGAYRFAIGYLVNYPKLQIAYPPLFHFTNAFLFWLLWPSALIARIVNLSFAVGAFMAFYLVGKRLFDGKTALIATILFSLSPFSLLYASRAFQDFTSFFFIMLAIFVYQKARENGKTKAHLLVGFLIALSALGKQFGAFLLVVFLIDTATKKLSAKEKLARLLAMFIPFFVVMGPYILALSAVGGIEINRLVATVYAPAQGEPTIVMSPEFWLYYIYAPQSSFLFYLPLLALFAFHVFLKQKYWKEMLAFFVLVYLMLSGITNKEIRFVQLFMLPVYLAAGNFLGGKIRSKGFLIAVLCVYAISSMLLFLPSVKPYMLGEISANGNIAVLSDDEPLYSSVIMWQLASQGKSVQVFRSCALGDNPIKFLEDNGVKTVVYSTWTADKSIEKVRDKLRLTSSFGEPKTEIYEFLGNAKTPDKKCNYICLTGKKVCE